MSSQDTTHDILIIGGGLVGSSLAIALDGAGLRVALVEAEPAKSADALARERPSYDERNLALSRATINALTALEVLPGTGTRATPIRKIHISRQGEFGVARLDAAAHGVDAFGMVMPARELGNALMARLDACRDLERHAPAKLVAVAQGTQALTATLQTAHGPRELQVRLLVGADGTGSFVRSALGIEVDNVDYAQTAFVTTLTTQHPLDCAYERFTASGPVALLPLGERRAGVVLTVPSTDAARVSALDDNGFIDLLHERFGWRLGRLSRPGRRMSYPLQRVQSRRLSATRGVLIGNAAQTLHPIAAQGFNLGLRDALTLAELLVEAGRAGVDPGGAALLAEYSERRREDRAGTIAMSDRLARFTASELPALKLLRSLGLVALDRVAPLQSLLALHGMGFRANVPKLALGQQL
jgi:2-octaprenyl-6-methoxyphenol hydroxylase